MPNMPIPQATARLNTFDPTLAPCETQQVLSGEEQDLLAAEFKLKQSKMTSKTISAIVNTIKARDILKSDGSNFGQWNRTLQEIGWSNLTGPEFFFTMCYNLTFEKIRCCFFGFAQMNLWYKFMLFKIDPNSLADGVDLTLKDLYEIKAFNVPSIMVSDAGFKADFEQHVELDLQRCGNPVFSSTS
ncbi:hypothetical protein VP01_8409g1 [Puccinia sorghi]|uniref:Uncharacterized protein n=1 Tax=Puccinia sorghi TaxID=27349 RepID=A0A0L6U9J1_9BASI|nr:hypothetical protein VP01_8409g1 [Puccinia sorghi]